MKYLAILLSAIILTTTAHAGEKSKSTMYTEDNTNIMITSTQPQFTIQLKSNPTTGYSWFLKKYNSKYIKPVKHSFQAPTTQLVGAPGYELWVFTVEAAAFTVPVQTTIKFNYARPWEKGKNTPEATFTVSTGNKK